MKTLIIILSVVFYLTTAIAQTNSKAAFTDEEINELTSNLAMKILLNDSQKSGIINILKTYRAELAKTNSGSVQETQSKLIASTNAQIISLLDSKQQMKFNVISSDWWKSVEKAESN